jgi:hypothetical protein
MLSSSSPRLISAAMVSAGIDDAASIITAGTAAGAREFCGLASGGVELPEFPAPSECACCADPAVTAAREPSSLISGITLAPTGPLVSAACVSPEAPVAGTPSTWPLACGDAALIASPSTARSPLNVCPGSGRFKLSILSISGGAAGSALSDAPASRTASRENPGSGATATSVSMSCVAAVAGGSASSMSIAGCTANS